MKNPPNLRHPPADQWWPWGQTMVPLKKGAGLKRKKSKTPPKKKNIFQSLHFQVPWFFFPHKIPLVTIFARFTSCKKPTPRHQNNPCPILKPWIQVLWKRPVSTGGNKMGFVVKHHAGFLADRNSNHKTAVSHLTWKLLLLQLQREALGPSKFKIET